MMLSSLPTHNMFDEAANNFGIAFWKKIFLILELLGVARRMFPHKILFSK